MSWSFWVVFGLGLLVFEILTPGGFFTVFFGVAAFVIAALSAAGVLTSGALQWLVFAILGSVLIVVLRPAVRKKFETDTPAVDQFVGQSAIALADFDANGRGQVELRGTTWTGVFAGSAPVRKGDRLRVTKVEGLSFLVEKE